MCDGLPIRMARPPRLTDRLDRVPPRISPPMPDRCTTQKNVTMCGCPAGACSVSLACGPMRAVVIRLSQRAHGVQDVCDGRLHVRPRHAAVGPRDFLGQTVPSPSRRVVRLAQSLTPISRLQVCAMTTYREGKPSEAACNGRWWAGSYCGDLGNGRQPLHHHLSRQTPSHSGTAARTRSQTPRVGVRTHYPCDGCCNGRSAEASGRREIRRPIRRPVSQPGSPIHGCCSATARA
jgi:hypothetical protein